MSSVSRRKFIQTAGGFVAGAAAAKSVALIATISTDNSVQAQTAPATPLTLATGVAGAIGSAYISASNQLVFVEYGGKISVIDLNNNLYTVLGTGYLQPEDIVVTSNGTFAYVTERIGTLLYVNLTQGSADRANAVVVAQGMIAPQQIALNEAGNQAYIVEYASSGRLLSIDLTSGQQTVLVAGLDQAVGLLIKPGTSVAYVSEQAGGGRLVQIDLNIGLPNVIVNDLPAPFFLRWNDSSYSQILLPLRDPFNRVVRLDLTQVPVTTTLLVDSVPFRPSSVAVLPADRLVVCSDSVVSAYTLAADSSLKLWSQLAAVKVLPGDAIINAGTTVSVKRERVVKACPYKSYLAVAVSLKD